MKRLYVYRCPSDHEVRLERPYQFAIVGCLARLPAWWSPSGSVTCDCSCWFERVELE